MSVRKMSVDEWIATPANPIQRDTERHAAKAKHLLKPLPVHAIVWAAELPTGKLVKLDGHTRALLWERNQVARPKTVEVHIMSVKDMEEAAELYKTFDSRDALETTPDKISGALRGMGYVPVSSLVASGAIAYAMRLAWVGVYGFAVDKRARDIYQAINEFAAELIALDELEFRKGEASTGIMAAILLSYRKHGDKVLPFWRAVKEKAGTKSGGQMDAVQGLLEMVLSKKSKWGGQQAYDTLGRALASVEKWMEGETMAQYPRPLDVISYLDQKTSKPKYRLVKKSAHRA